jgi:ribose-phosphate pyrophosphokinase
MKIIACNSNRPMAEAVAAALGIPLTQASVRRFADMEVFVEIHENIRGEDTFVVQSTSYPANDNLMELLITLDALKRASARRITAVIPYFGYARQDRKSGPRTPISAKLVANLIAAAGANRVLTLDLHAAQIQGFFDIPVDNLFAATSRNVSPAVRRWWSAPMSAAWCARARSRRGSARTSPSSTSAGRARACPR